MILSHHRYFKNFILLKNLCYWTQQVLLASCLIALLWVVIAGNLNIRLVSKKDQTLSSQIIPNDLILSLLETKDSPCMLIKQQIEKDLVFLGEDDHQRLLIGLASNKTKQSFGLKDPFFLSFPEGKACFTTQGPLQIVCDKILGDFVTVKVEIPAIQESFQFEKRIDANASAIFLEFPQQFSELETAKVYKPDLLQTLSCKSICRLDVHSCLECIEIESGSWLVFKNGSWKQKDKDSVYEALVESISHNGVSLRVFDREQGVSKILDIPFYEEESLPFSIEELFSEIKVRGEEIVICKMGKQNCLLKKGDWLIKNQSYWKAIKSSQDLERYLSFEQPGELFVFEGLEKKQSHLVFKGVVFSKMRTNSYPVAIPISSQTSLVEKKPLRTLHNRKEKRPIFNVQADQDELLKLKGK